MILGDRVDKIKAEVKDRSKYKGITIHMKVDDVIDKDGDLLEIKYTTTFDYTQDSALMEISGTIVAKEDSKEKKRLLKEWKNKKQLPLDYLEKLLNVINFVDSAHGTIVARILNIRPPIKAMKLTLKK